MTRDTEGNRFWLTLLFVSLFLSFSWHPYYCLSVCLRTSLCPPRDVLGRKKRKEEKKRIEIQADQTRREKMRKTIVKNVRKKNSKLTSTTKKKLVSQEVKVWEKNWPQEQKELSCERKEKGMHLNFVLFFISWRKSWVKNGVKNGEEAANEKESWGPKTVVTVKNKNICNPLSCFLFPSRSRWRKIPSSGQRDLRPEVSSFLSLSLHSMKETERKTKQQDRVQVDAGNARERKVSLIQESSKCVSKDFEGTNKKRKRQNERIEKTEWEGKQRKTCTSRGQLDFC